VARELLFTGRRINAAEAKAIGLVNRVVPSDQLAAEVAALARSIAEKSPLALKLLKRALIHGAEMPLAAALAHEQAMIALALDSQDAHEGLSAFLEKRKASFQGR
jgi:enoyl-CoA hydratase